MIVLDYICQAAIPSPSRRRGHPITRPRCGLLKSLHYTIEPFTYMAVGSTFNPPPKKKICSFVKKNSRNPWGVGV
jgi:hypothetical protein